MEEIATIKNKLKDIENSFMAFRMILRSLGSSPSMNRPSILWMGINLDLSLFDLQKAILNDLNKNNIADGFNYSFYGTIG